MGSEKNTFFKNSVHQCCERTLKIRRNTSFLLLAVLFSFIPLSVTAQVPSPPSLIAGLSGISASRGDIDVVLLTSIIAEKQEELKNEFIKRYVLERIAKENYVLWEYSYNSLEILFNSKNRDVIEKELLEHATNLAVIYGLTETYLQVSTKYCNRDLYQLLIETIGNNVVDDVTVKAMLACFDCNTGVSDRVTKLREVNGSVLVHQLSKIKYCYPQGKDTLETPFSRIFSEMVFDIIKDNQVLKNELQFMQSSLPAGQNYYANGSMYVKLMKDTKPNSALPQLSQRMDKELNTLLTNYYLFKELGGAGSSLFESVITNMPLKDLNKHIDKSSFSIKKGATSLQKGDSIFAMLLSDNKILKMEINSKVIEAAKQQVNDMMDGIKKKYRQELDSLPEAIAELNDSKKDLSNHLELSDRITEAYQAFYAFASRTNKIDHSTYRAFQSKDLYYLREVQMPLLIELVTNHGFDKQYLRIAQDYQQVISLSLYIQAMESLGEYSGLLPLLEYEVIENFISFLKRFHELDRVKTYEYVLNTIKDAYVLLPEEAPSARMIQRITDGVEKFAIVNTEENYIKISVEDLIVALGDKVGSRKRSPITPYFSVGLNQITAINYPDNASVKALLNEEGERLRSFGYAGEKIGVKLKIINWAYWRSYGPGDIYKSGNRSAGFHAKPLVSDWYLLLYGSGLIYNLTNTVTQSSFQAPLLGMSTGLAFSNSLDFNIFINFPLLSSESLGEAIQNRQMFGLSFDIKLMEYITRLRKKKEKDK